MDIGEKTLARDFNYLGVLSRVSDSNNDAKNEVNKISKNILFSTDYKKILKDESITSVAIATPAKTHYKLVKEALIAKKTYLLKSHYV